MQCKDSLFQLHFRGWRLVPKLAQPTPRHPKSDGTRDMRAKNVSAISARSPVHLSQRQRQVSARAARRASSSLSSSGMLNTLTGRGRSRAASGSKRVPAMPNRAMSWHVIPAPGSLPSAQVRCSIRRALPRHRACCTCSARVASLATLPHWLKEYCGQQRCRVQRGVAAAGEGADKPVGCRNRTGKISKGDFGKPAHRSRSQPSGARNGTLRNGLAG